MAINWQNTPVLDSVQLPGSETKYWVKDTEARDKIESLVNATKYIGITTTALTDGAETNPIVINGENVTAQTGDIAIYKGLTTPEEFIFDGSEWQLLGGPTIDNLGDLAYKDSASGSYTPQGSVAVSLPGKLMLGIDIYSGDDPHYADDHHVQFTTTMSSYSANHANVITQLPSLSQALYSISFIGLSATWDDPEEGPSVPLNMDITTGVCASVISSGSLPSITSSVMSAEVSGSTLVFGLTSLGFNAGAFPEYSFNNVVTDVSYSETEAHCYDFSLAGAVSYSGSATTQSVITGITNVQASGNLWYYISSYYTQSSSYPATATFYGSASTITVS